MKTRHEFNHIIAWYDIVNHNNQLKTKEQKKKSERRYWRYIAFLERLIAAVTSLLIVHNGITSNITASYRW